MRTFFLLGFFFSFFTPVLRAQNYPIHFSQISMQDGLSQNTVRAILEDGKGFIWAGTLDGLNRYDGYRIITYKPQIGNPKSLTDHRIKDVYRDRNNYLWIKTYKNEFCCYDPISDSFVDYKPGLQEEASDYSNYYESSTGDIWLWGSTGRYMRIRNKNRKFEAIGFSTPQSSSKNRLKFLFEDSDASIWIGSESGLYKITDDQPEEVYRKKNSFSFVNAIETNNKIYFIAEESAIIAYDMKRNTFETISQPQGKRFLNAALLSTTELLITTPQGIISFNVHNRQFSTPVWGNDQDLTGNIELLLDKNKGIWIYNHSGIVWYYNPGNGKTKKMELIPPHIASIIDLERYNVFIDSQNLIWITTYGNGLFCYNPETDILSNYIYQSNKNSPASDYLLSITEDRFGNIWVGSEYAGIIKVIKTNNNIQIIRPEKETSIGKNNNVRTIYEDSYDNIWIGTKNGHLYMYDNNLTTGKCIRENLNPYTLIEDKKNRMWLGTKGNGLYVLDGKTGKELAHYVEDKENPKGLSDNTIFTILQDDKDRIWIGSFRGGLHLVEESPEGKLTFNRFFYDEGNRSYIRCLYQDSRGMIWMGSSDGVIRFNPEELIKDPKAFISYRLDLHEKNTINSNDIKAIYEDNDKQIWIGTAGGGLNKYMVENNEEYFIAYTTDNGLSGDIVSGIMEDKNGNLWISSENGISKFNKKEVSFLNYHFSEKTYGNHFNENANEYCRNGNMLWGSLDGLLIFNPESLVPEKETPPVTLTGFFIYDQKVEPGEDSPLQQSVSYSDKIKLTHRQNTFTIEFSGLFLKDPQKNKYTYMLKNYDKQWSPLSRINTATYKNLPPGNYVFMVQGTNSDGIQNNQLSEIEIVIAPPFTKTVYAYILYAILVLAALYFALKLTLKFNKLNNDIEVEKQLTNYKLRFFTNISHEFRTPLTLIRGAVENLNDQSNVPERVLRQIHVMSRNTTILIRLIDQLLEFRKIQNNVLTLNLEETDIVDFTREIYSGFKETASSKQMNYTFVCSESSFKMHIDRRKVDKIVYNLLSNAFKFTPKEGSIELTVEFNRENQLCILSVKDNGIGISKEKQHLLFSRFMQINFSAGGTGIGLSLVKEFVEVHKGKIKYEDNNEQGSVFRIELSTDPNTYKGENFITHNIPDIIEEKTDKITMPSDTPALLTMPEIDDATLSNYKLLIIDDNDDIRNFLVDKFSGYLTTDVAENGEEGLKKAIENNPDLIICDVMMPEPDGFEVTRQLKKEFQTCHIPVILLTAHSSLEHQLEGIESGADAYVMKPFSIKYLMTRVFKLIEQREKLKKRFSSEHVFDGNLISGTDQDKDFFNLINHILEEHISDTQFSVDKFAELSKLKRTIFYKKVKGITGLSPNELIKIKRLKKAGELLLTGEFTVSEVSYKVGFDDPFYFSKCFKAHYNCSPSKFGRTTPAAKEVNV